MGSNLFACENVELLSTGSGRDSTDELTDTQEMNSREIVWHERNIIFERSCDVRSELSNFPPATQHAVTKKAALVGGENVQTSSLSGYPRLQLRQ